MIDVFIRAAATWTAERGAPRAELIPAAMRRRCSLATRLVAEVTGELVGAGMPLARAAIVHGTAFGEIATTAELLDMMRDGDGALSPLRFATSVHNTATGQLAIAQGHTGRSTTLCAGEQTVAAAWLEAQAWLACGASDVLLVVADEPMPAQLHPHHDGLAVALWLTAEVAPGPRAVARWQAPRRDVPAAAAVPAPLRSNPVRWAWSIVEALGSAACVRLEPDDVRGYASSLELRPPAG